MTAGGATPGRRIAAGLALAALAALAAGVPVAAAPPARGAQEVPARGAGAAAARSAPRPGRSVEYRVRLDVDLENASYRGTETVLVANRGKDSVEELHFDLAPNFGAQGPEDRLLAVTGVRVGGAEAGTVDRVETLTVKLPGGLAPGASVAVELAFEGRARRYGAPQVGLTAHVSDQVTTVLEPERRRARTGADLMPASGGAMLLGNPFPTLAPAGGGRRGGSAGPMGRPVPVGPAAAEIELRPGGEGELAVAPGSTDDEEAGGVFSTDDLGRAAVFAARGMVVDTREAGGILIRSIHSPGHAAAARRALDTLTASLAAYSELFGPPGLKDVTLVEAPLPPGVASESFSGLIAVASAYYTDIRGAEGESLPGFLREAPDLMEGALEFAVAHEAAHLWWGESVATDAERSPFMTESLSSYSAVVATERARGKEAAARAVEQQLRSPYRVFRMFGGEDLPVGEPAGRFPNYFAYAAILQAKGGLWLAATREALGDERFFAALRAFHERHAGRTARPQDLVQALTPRKGPDRERLERLHARWLRERFGDADVATPEFAVRAPADKSGFERFGRFVVRNLARVGKAAAKPF